MTALSFLFISPPVRLPVPGRNSAYAQLHTHCVACPATSSERKTMSRWKHGSRLLEQIVSTKMMNFMDASIINDHFIVMFCSCSLFGSLIAVQRIIQIRQVSRTFSKRTRIQKVNSDFGSQTIITSRNLITDTNFFPKFGSKLRFGLTSRGLDNVF